MATYYVKKVRLFIPAKQGHLQKEYKAGTPTPEDENPFPHIQVNNDTGTVEVIISHTHSLIYRNIPYSFETDKDTKFV